MLEKSEKSFKFDFETMTLHHGVEYPEGFEVLYSVEMEERDIDKLQFILWSVQQELSGFREEDFYGI